MAAKKKKKQILVPEAEEKMHELRYQIAKRLGYIVVNAEDWWEELTPMQKSEINGHVTKLMIDKAKMEMMNGNFKPY
ncbi:gp266 [Bacillus phage G]|uniref:Gp266 n=1 Tax=Bacillus phage G TaxID=2884420 RepID=G3MA07_9CAUD|nr:gp266 [Bacillus phage G]AEO93525.1 gp266 [Bacillus phage G]